VVAESSPGLFSRHFPRATAGTAETTAVRENASVFGGELMQSPPTTFCFACPSHVLGLCYGLQVCWVDAGRSETQMVDDQVLRYSSMRRFVDNTVYQCDRASGLAVLDRDLAVAETHACPCPDPASAQVGTFCRDRSIPIYVCPDSLGGRRNRVVSNTGATSRAVQRPVSMYGSSGEDRAALWARLRSRLEGHRKDCAPFGVEPSPVPAVRGLAVHCTRSDRGK
jgi:hypothetical protein